MTKLTKTLSIATLCLTVAGLSGCAGRTAAFSESEGNATGTEAPTAGATEGAGDSADIAAGDAAWEGRVDPAKTLEAIAAWDKALEADPNNYGVLVKLTRGNYYYADSFLRDKEDEYLKTMDKAVYYGERALGVISPEFRQKMENKGKFHEAITVVPKEGVPAMYWYSSALGKWAKKKSFAVLLGQKDNIKATMEHVMSLDENFYHAGPHRYFGAVYAIAPKVAGGDLSKSKVSFEKSMELAPNFLGTKVLMAEHYATKIDNEELFTKLLNEVVAADPNVLPDVAPEMQVEQQKAKDLLANIDEYF